MKKILRYSLMLLLTCMAFFLSGCFVKEYAGNNIKKETIITLKDEAYSLEIKNIKITNSKINIESTKDSTSYIKLLGDEVLLDKIKITNKNNKITIDGNRFNTYAVDNLEIIFSQAKINNLTLSGNISYNIIVLTTTFDITLKNNCSGTLISSNPLDSLNATLHDNSSITFDNLEVDNCKINLNGSSNIIGNGITNNLNINSSGTINISFRSFIAKNIKMNIVGQINAVITASETLIIKATGTGNINYSGNPITDINVSPAIITTKL